MPQLTFDALSYYAGSGVALLRDVEPRSAVLRLFAPGSRVGKGPCRIRLHRMGETFLVRSAMDVWSVKEAFIDRFYERYGFPIAPGWTVGDIGAAIGEFTVLAAKVPGTSVLACEPFPGSVELLRANVDLNKLMNVTVIPEAVAGESGIVVLDLRGQEPLKYVSARHDRAVVEPGLSEGTIAIPAISLEELVARTPNGHFDVLKLDCEGAEYEILMQAPLAVLAHVDRIVMEYHDRTTTYTHLQLERFLTEAGYEVSSVPNVARPDQIGYLWAARKAIGGLTIGR